MSGQVIELMIFAGIAFFVINKLISTLGATSEDEQNSRHPSFFGESRKMKDVTSSYRQEDTASSFFGGNIIASKSSKAAKFDLDGLVKRENQKAVAEGLEQVMEMISNFDLNKFIKGARLAFQMIIESAEDGNHEQMEQLIDKRYLSTFLASKEKYGHFLSNDALEIFISEVYVFGNSIFIKVAFLGQYVTSERNHLAEEWTFTKSAISEGNEWYLTNIDTIS